MIAPLLCAARRGETMRAPRQAAERAPMKRTDLEKLQGKKIEGQMRREKLPDRYGAGSGALRDRRAERRRDEAAGLVPFAVKLPAALATALHARARADGVTLDALAAALLAGALPTPSTPENDA